MKDTKGRCFMSLINKFNKEKLRFLSSIKFLAILAIFVLNFQLLQADPPANNPNDPFRDFNLDSISPFLPAVVRNCTENCDTSKFDTSFVNKCWKPLCIINGQSKGAYIINIQKENGETINEKIIID